MKKVAIFCGGPSSEYEVSLSSAKSILKNIDKKKYSIYIFFIKKNLKSAFYKTIDDITPPDGIKFKDFTELLKNNKKNFDIALLSALHGEFGEDGTIQILLENLGIKYTGSNSKSSKLCMDKFKSMEKVRNINDINIPRTFPLFIQNLNKNAPMGFPFIIKPNFLGSSVLVFYINSQKEYKKAVIEIKKKKVKNVLIQQLIKGLEISCGCLQGKNGKFINLPPIEIHPKANFFDYRSKYVVGLSEEIVPPISISKKESDKISNITVKIHELLKCSTYSRSDFIYMNEKIYYLETNTLPGMTSTSLLPKEAAANNISFSKLIDFFIEESI